METNSKSRKSKDMKESKFFDMFIEELKDIYHAEHQLTKALPKMAEAAHSKTLADGFTKHLAQTNEHIARLEKVFSLLGEKAEAKPCKAMKGLVAEGEEALEEYSSPSYVRDMAIIIASQKIEHYEISGYGSLAKIALELGEKAVADLLNQTLGEETKTAQLLSDLASSSIMQEAEMEN